VQPKIATVSNTVRIRALSILSMDFLRGVRRKFMGLGHGFCARRAVAPLRSVMLLIELHPIPHEPGSRTTG
jgi:hypothetical protein